METALVTAAALLPVALLAFYIYRRDRHQPEPVSKLLLAFALGLASVPLSFCFSIPFSLMGLFPQEVQGAWGAVRVSFWGAAIPEEVAKFIVLWLLLRRNRHFDEMMDGIVYAVCVSLGFAALENLMYLFGEGEDYLALGIRRALFAIPGHFCFGVLMGYYYSITRFDPRARVRHAICVLAAPVAAHGIYDTLLFLAELSQTMSGILSLAFIVFCHQMWRFASRRIEWHLEADGIITR